MTHKIHPCIWCNNNAKEMANYYVSIFPHCHIIDENPMVVMLAISGQKFMLLNGGSMFVPNPSISFMYLTDKTEEIDRICEKLAENGKFLMQKDKYPWSENYAWVEDKYKVSWQLYFGKKEEIYQTVAPKLMFCNSSFGKAKKAAQFYVDIFKNSTARGTLEDKDGHVQHGEFIIENYLIMMMDAPGKHNFSFTEGISLVVNCQNQEEIDFLWETLTKNGGQESRCGWLKDAYGISWQIVPENWEALLANNKNAMDALLKMNKIEIEKLK